MAEHMRRLAFPDDDGPLNPFTTGVNGWVWRDVWALLVGQDSTVKVRVSWSPGDPFAVALRFMVGRDEDGDVVWVLSRTVLAQGLWHPAGMGDVHVHPDGCSVLLWLGSPSGRAVFVFDAGELADFLACTDAVFASAERVWRAGMDTAITGLLDGSTR
jgi:hypothetical protein